MATSPLVPPGPGRPTERRASGSASDRADRRPLAIDDGTGRRATEVVDVSVDRTATIPEQRAHVQNRVGHVQEWIGISTHLFKASCRIGRIAGLPRFRSAGAGVLSRTHVERRRRSGMVRRARAAGVAGPYPVAGNGPRAMVEPSRNGAAARAARSG